MKLICLASLGKLKQKELNISCLSNVDHEGRMTLFYSGGGIKPVKNSHYWVEIYCGSTPFTKYNPNARRSFLNKALETLEKTILLT